MESFKGEDFVIRVRPTEIDGEWTGEIDISIISQAENPLDDEDYAQVMHFCKMMCATVPLMEVNKDLRDLAHHYVMNVVDNDEEDVLDDDVIITREDGNVIHLSFGSKTKGNA